MKKVLFLIFCLYMLNVSASAELYCPTPGEYQDKLSDYQSKIVNSLKQNNLDSGATLNEMENISNDLDTYLKSIVPACVYYFKNPNTNYDCKKLQTLGAAYMVLDSKLQPIAKTKINKLPPQVQQKCSFEYEVMNSIINGTDK